MPRVEASRLSLPSLVVPAGPPVKDEEMTSDFGPPDSLCLYFIHRPVVIAATGEI
jgi:hypothetical protein